MLGITLLPAALFGLLAGVYVDRWDRRRTMIWADLIRAGLVAVIPFVARFGIGWVYVIAFMVSSVSLFFIPAKRAIIPDLVPADELMAATLSTTPPRQSRSSRDSQSVQRWLLYSATQ